MYLLLIKIVSELSQRLHEDELFFITIKNLSY